MIKIETLEELNKAFYECPKMWGRYLKYTEATYNIVLDADLIVYFHISKLLEELGYLLSFIEYNINDDLFKSHVQRSKIESDEVYPTWIKFNDQVNCEIFTVNSLVEAIIEWFNFYENKI